MVIFHCYVKLPEGNPLGKPWFGLFVLFRSVNGGIYQMGLLAISAMVKPQPGLINVNDLMTKSSKWPERMLKVEDSLMEKILVAYIYHITLYYIALHYIIIYILLYIYNYIYIILYYIILYYIILYYYIYIYIIHYIIIYIYITLHHIIVFYYSYIYTLYYMLYHINYRIICRMYMFSCAVLAPLAPGTRSESHGAMGAQ